MSEVKVRDAVAADADGLARLCAQLGYPSPPAAFPERLARMTRDDLVRVFVATDGGRIAGLATAHIRHTVNHDHPLAQLTLLVVDETVRGTGVGRALVERVERFARDGGCARIVVTTHLDRAGAHAFYERLEYTHTGRRYAKDFHPVG